MKKEERRLRAKLQLQQGEDDSGEDEDEAEEEDDEDGAGWGTRKRAYYDADEVSHQPYTLAQYILGRNSLKGARFMFYQDMAKPED